MQAGQHGVEALRVLCDVDDGEVVAARSRARGGPRGSILRVIRGERGPARGSRLAEVDDAGETLAQQRGGERVLERRIALSRGVYREHADARILEVRADERLFLQAAQRARAQALRGDFRADRDGVDAAEHIVGEDGIAVDEAGGLRVDAVGEQAVVLEARAAVDVDADLLLDGGAHGGVQRAALVGALTRGRDGRSLRAGSGQRGRGRDE